MGHNSVTVKTQIPSFIPRNYQGPKKQTTIKFSRTQSALILNVKRIQVIADELKHRQITEFEILGKLQISNTEAF